MTLLLSKRAIVFKTRSVKRCKEEKRVLMKDEEDDGPPCPFVQQCSVASRNAPRSSSTDVYAVRSLAPMTSADARV